MIQTTENNGSDTDFYKTHGVSTISRRLKRDSSLWWIKLLPQQEHLKVLVQHRHTFPHWSAVSQTWRRRIKVLLFSLTAVRLRSSFTDWNWTYYVTRLPLWASVLYEAFVCLSLCFAFLAHQAGGTHTGGDVVITKCGFSDFYWWPARDGGCPNSLVLRCD